MLFKGLDEKDKQILDILSTNARMSYAEIGQAIGISSVAAKNHILSLERRGIIEEYCVIVNPQKIETYLSVFFDILIDLPSLEEAVEILERREDITQLYIMSGPGKLHAHGLFEGCSEAEHFVRQVLYKLPGLKQVNCEIIFSRVKDKKGMRL